jgi:hypothetical protein
MAILGGGTDAVILYGAVGWMYSTKVGSIRKMEREREKKSLWPIYDATYPYHATWVQRNNRQGVFPRISFLTRLHGSLTSWGRMSRGGGLSLLSTYMHISAYLLGSAVHQMTVQKKPPI